MIVSRFISGCIETKDAIKMSESFAYKSYLQYTALPGIESLLLWSKEDCDRWDNDVKEITESNRAVFLENVEVLKAVGKFLNETFPASYVLDKRGLITKNSNKIIARLLGYPQLQPNVPTPYDLVRRPFKHDSKEYIWPNNISMQSSLYEIKALAESIIEKDKTKSLQSLRYESKCFGLSKEYGVNVEDFNSKADFIKRIESIARMKFIDENYSDGTEIDIGCCDNCDSWTVGERRCSCGNRRVDLTVEGNILDGFYVYGESY